MTTDKSNSIHLPGSGTVGIEQLSQLSNIQSPGIWLYRIDEESVSPCMHPELQPPYCDAPSPTLINSRRPSPTQTQTESHITHSFEKLKQSTPSSAIFKPVVDNEEESQEENIERTLIKKPKGKFSSFKQEHGEEHIVC